MGSSEEFQASICFWERSTTQTRICGGVNEQVEMRDVFKSDYSQKGTTQAAHASFQNWPSPMYLGKHVYVQPVIQLLDFKANSNTFLIVRTTHLQIIILYIPFVQ
jgi:hypothetical protein